MAAYPKGAQKIRLDYNVDRATYDDFIKACSHRGFAPAIIVEKFMEKYAQTGQI